MKNFLNAVAVLAVFGSVAGAQEFKTVLNVRGEEFIGGMAQLPVARAKAVDNKAGLAGDYANRAREMDGIFAALYTDINRVQNALDTDNSGISGALDAIGAAAEEYKGKTVGSGFAELKSALRETGRNLAYLQSRPQVARKLAAVTNDVRQLGERLLVLEATHSSLKEQLRYVSAQAEDQAQRITAMGDAGGNPAAKKELGALLRKTAALGGIGGDTVINTQKLFAELNAGVKRMAWLLDNNNSNIVLPAQITRDIRDNIIRRIEMLQNM
ncbi:MAG TPA: hypothetical protein PKI19_06760 [Elusimicrobiales bacterium]|nr:hypothetical protein [Elusimicrobiales bacterium]